jgi:hypothetical protein
MFNLKKITKRSLAFFTIIAILACGPVLDIDEFVSFFQPESSSVDLKYYSYFFARNTNWGDGEGYGRYEYTANTQPDYNGQIWAKRKENKSFTKADETYLELANEAPGSYPDSLTRLEYLSSGLLKILQTNYAHTKDYFLKERYGYLIVRYAFYMSFSEKTVEYFNVFVKPLKRKSYIANWALSYKAGAELRLKQDAQSFYDFAQVARNEPDRGNYPFNSTRVFSVIPLKESLRLCQNNKEKAAVYALASVQRFIDALPYLEKILELDPQNPLLELLVTREINKNEFIAMGSPKYPRSALRDGKPFLPLGNALTKDISPYFQKLRILVEKCSKLPQFQQNPFWETANAYMAWVVRDFDSANVYLSNAKSLKTNNKDLTNQILLQEMLLSASTMEALTPELEAQWIGYLEKFAYPKNYQQNFAFLKATQLMRQHYQAIIKPQPKSWWQFLDNKSTTQIKDIPAKLFLLAAASSAQTLDRRMKKLSEKDDFLFYPDSNHSLFAIEDSTSLNMMQEVANFVNKPQSVFEKKLIKLSGIDRNYAMSGLGMKFLQKQEYAKAAQAFASIPKQFWVEYFRWNTEKWKEEDYFFKTNPFKVNNISLTNFKDSIFTPVAFCQKMATFKKRVEQDENDTEAWLGLAIGSYSIGYFGDWWLLSRRYHTGIPDFKHEGYSWDESKEPITNRFAVWERLDAKDNYHNQNLTLSYCNKCIAKSKDKNIAAKAAYLAAQCWFVKGDNEDGKKNKMKGKESRTHFYNLLKTKYSDTEFEDQIIRECATYDIFVNGRQTLSAHEENVNNPQTEEVSIVAPEPQTTDSSDDLWLIFLFLGFVCLMIWVAEEL